MIHDGIDRAFDGQVRYLISYYDRNEMRRKFYLNRSSFSNLSECERELKLLKKREDKKKVKDWIRFKIEKSVIKKAINKSCS